MYVEILYWIFLKLMEILFVLPLDVLDGDKPKF